MKKKIVFCFLLLFLLCSSAFSISWGRYSFTEDMKNDADLVLSYFKTVSSPASSAYKRIYDSLYADANNYILNKNKGKFHKEDCSSVKKMNPENQIEVFCSRQLLIDIGYEPCGSCKP